MQCLEALMMSLTTVVELGQLPHHRRSFRVREPPPLRYCRFVDVALGLVAVCLAQKSALYLVSTVRLAPIGQMR